VGRRVASREQAGQPVEVGVVVPFTAATFSPVALSMPWKS
jgi:hypothetical protein